MAITHKDRDAVLLVVRDHIDEPTANYWSDAELVRKINRAKDSLCRFLMTLKQDIFDRRYTPLTLTADTDPPVFDLPDGFGRLATIRVTTAGYKGTIFTPVDRSRPEFQSGLNSEIQAGNPGEFLYDLVFKSGAATGGEPPIAYPTAQLVISPIPRITMACMIEYLEVVPDLTAGSDKFGVLDPFVEYIELRAAAYALMKGNAGNWKAFLDLSEAMKPEIKSALSSFQKQNPEFVQGFLED